MAEADDVNHMIMQCPCLQSERDDLFDNLNERPDGFGSTILRGDYDTLAVLSTDRKTNTWAELLPDGRNTCDLCVIRP